MWKTAVLLAALLASGCPQARSQVRPAELDLSPLEAGKSAPAVPEALATEIMFCAGAPEVGARLRCFEDIATRLGVQVKPVTGVVKSGGNGASLTWSTETGLSPDGSPWATIALQSSEVTSAESFFSDDRAGLFLRCQGHKTSLYVNFQKPITPNQTLVYMTMDGGNPSGSTWVPSKSGTSLGLWTTEAAAPMARMIALSTRTTVKVTLPQGRSVTALFEVGGMAEAMAPVRAACGW